MATATGNVLTDVAGGDVHEMIDGRVAHYQTIAEGDKDVVMCFTEYPTFRHTIYPEYKANRKHKRKQHSHYQGYSSIF